MKELGSLLFQSKGCDRILIHFNNNWLSKFLFRFFGVIAFKSVLSFEFVNLFLILIIMCIELLSKAAIKLVIISILSIKVLLIFNTCDWSFPNGVGAYKPTSNYLLE